MRVTPHLIVAALLPLLVGCPFAGDPADPAPLAPESSRPLGTLVDETLEENRRFRRLSSELHGGWQILHGVLAYGELLKIDTPLGTRSAVDYLLAGGRVAGFEPLPGDLLGDPPRRGLRMELQPTTKVGQGHRDQWLAVLAQAGLERDAVITAGGHEFTMIDWVRQVEHDIPRNFEAEFSWTLIGLLAYRPTDHRWVARDGNVYDIELLVASELSKSLPASPCGGTHRLIGMAMALEQRRAEDAPVTGPWAEAETVIGDSIEMAKRNQNPDGSFSVDYHHRTGWTRDLGETLGTTGHVLEFLALAAPDETLREPWVERSVRRLCEVLEQCRDVDLECGVLYHALHGLREYRRRIGGSAVELGASGEPDAA